MGNRMEVNQILKQYKVKDGTPNFPALFQIPTDGRISFMAQQDFTRINVIVIGAITMALEAMNLKKTMNEFQVLELAETIIDTSDQDNLSFEDLMLFLQGLVRGKYKIPGDTMDLPRFMELFDQYRDERWQAGIKLRDDLHEQYKIMGDTGRSVQNNELAERFGNMAGKLSEMKDQWRQTKRENDVIKQADKFFGK